MNTSTSIKYICGISKKPYNVGTGLIVFSNDLKTTYYSPKNTPKSKK